MRLIVRSKWTSILFGPHFPRPINDDSARSAGCFCWLVHSFPEIFSLQLARGEARKSSRNLAPRSLSFCTPGSFVHNRYCLCELKLFVLRWETGGVRNTRRGFKCVACSLLIMCSCDLSHSSKPRSPLCGCSHYSSLPATITSYTAPYTPLFLSPSFLFLPHRFKKEQEGVGSSGNIWLNINYWHSCFFFFFFWQLGAPQRAESLQDRLGIHSEGIPSNLLGYKGKKEQGGCRGEREDPTVTNDYEHLLISLALIILEGKLGLVCTPTVFGNGIVEEEADRELSLSVGG